MRYTITAGKGGTGCTATAVVLAEWLSQTQGTVLLDFDPQADSTKLLGAETSGGAFSLLDGNSVADNRQAVRYNLWVVAGNGDTGAMEDILSVRQSVQKDALAKIAQRLRGDPATMVIDTAKSGLVRELAVRAADVVIIPTTLDYNSCCNTLSMVAAVREWKREASKIVVLPMFMDGRRKVAQAAAINTLIDGLAESASVYRPGIIRSAAMESAAWNGKTVFGSGSACGSLVASYVEFFDWLRDQIGA